MSDWLGMIELCDVCATARTRNLELFATLGEWIRSTPDGDRQRLYAEACHRHAWHAELWAARAPTLPRSAHDRRAAAQPDPEPHPAAVDEDDRHGWYTATLTGLRDELATLGARIDATLDPSTARTIQLVAADLADLTDRAERAGPAN